MKEYLWVLKETKDPQYYKENGKWFYFGSNLQIIDSDAIDILEDVFTETYKST